MIKYVLPIAWVIRQKVPLTQYIYFWDAWWIVHVAVGFHFIRHTQGVWKWAVLLAIAEIGIIAVKLVSYLQHPNVDFWHLNWFINKSLLLFYFGVLLIWLLRKDVQQVLREKQTA